MPRFSWHGHAVPGFPHPRGAGTDEHRQDAPCDRAHARPSERHDRVSAAPAGARELRPDREAERGAGGRAHHGRGKDRPAQPRLLRLHRRIDAARPPGRFPRGRRDPALRRSRARPCLHRAPPPRSRACRDDVPRRRHDPPAAAPSRSRGRVHRPAALLDAHLHRAAQGDAPAAAQRRRRLRRLGRLRSGRAGAAAARRHRRRARRLEPQGPQRPGRHVPGRRGRLPRRDRCDRHGAQHGCRPCRLREAREVRRPRAAPPDRRRRSPRSPAVPVGT